MSISELSPRLLPSPLPSPQNSVKPSVPDISIMEDEPCKDNRKFYFQFLDQLLKNDTNDSNDEESSIENPRKEEMSKHENDFDWGILSNKKKTKRYVRRKSIPSINTRDFDDVFISDNSSHTPETPCPVQWNVVDFPCTVSSSTPSSYQIKSFRVDQFSPINEEPTEESLLGNIKSRAFYDSRENKEINIDPQKNYSINSSQKQNYHRRDVSAHMNQLAEKYLPKNRNDRKENENQRLNNNSNDCKYSIASEKYLAKYGLLPKDYKLSEKENNSVCQTADDFSIATKRYMKKHGLVKNTIKHRNPSPPQDDDFSLQINLLPNVKIFE